MKKQNRWKKQQRLASKVTLMLVPNDTGSIMKMSLPPWIFAASLLITAGLVLLLSVVGLSLKASLEMTQNDLTITHNTASYLKNENDDYKAKIHYLKGELKNVEKNMAVLQAMGDQVVSMVGIDREVLENSHEEE